MSAGNNTGPALVGLTLAVGGFSLFPIGGFSLLAININNPPISIESPAKAAAIQEPYSPLKAIPPSTAPTPKAELPNRVKAAPAPFSEAPTPAPLAAIPAPRPAPAPKVEAPAPVHSFPSETNLPYRAIVAHDSEPLPYYSLGRFMFKSHGHGIEEVDVGDGTFEYRCPDCHQLLRKTRTRLIMQQPTVAIR